MEATKKDIETIADIRLLVDTFYGRIRENELLGPIFNGTIGERWPEHLEKMYRFWQTILLEEHTYMGTPFPPHAQMPIGADHFEAWLSTWHDTVDGLFSGTRANDAKWRGNKMAALFLSKIEYYREHYTKPLL
jgi:hemoglobin